MEDLSRWYAVLEVKPGASREEVRRAYRDLAQVWHPDRFHGRADLENRTEERLKAINEAYRQIAAAWAEEDRGTSAPQADQKHHYQRSAGPKSGDTDATGSRNHLGSVGKWWNRLRSKIPSSLDRRRILFALAVLTAGGFGFLGAWILTGQGLIARDGEGVRFADVSAGAWHACGLDVSGSIYCWGLDDDGQLGNGEGSDVCGRESTFPCSLHPRRIQFGTPFVAVVAGWSHTCALAENGEAFCWGAGFAGQTGLGRSTVETIPTRISAPPLGSITTFGQHACGLSGTGAVYCWGSDESGQLGNDGRVATCVSDSGPFPCALEPTEIGRNREWTAVSAGASHTCALSDGGAFCWGSNRSGQLGSPGGIRCGSSGDDYFCRQLPQRVASDETFTHISAGASHSCALSGSGAAWCWGDNRYGQLGNATVESSSAPVRVAGNHVFRSIEARGNQTCATAASGRTFCWGHVPAGLASTARSCSGVPCRLVPASLRFPAGSRVAAGLEFACILAERYQNCWGRNDVGQLGNGSVSIVAGETPQTPFQDSPRRVRPRPVRSLQNFLSSVFWGLRRFVTRLMSPILNELERI